MNRASYEKLTENEVLVLAKNKDQGAINDLERRYRKYIESYVRLKYKYLKNLQRCDLIQEATIAWVTAIDTFDIKKGNKFLTYATWCIQSHLSLVISRSNFSFKIPKEKLAQVSKEIKTQGEVISDEATVTFNVLNTIPLDAPAGLYGSVSIRDSFPVEEEEWMLDLERVNRIVETLDERSKTFYKLRHDDGFNMNEIGKMYYLSNQRIQQVLSEAYGYIRSEYVRMEEE